jgi:Xaa-Pro aminopeptidase
MKLNEFQSRLKEKKVDVAFLVYPDINLTYFTGQKVSYGYLAIGCSRAVLYHTQLDTLPVLGGVAKKLLKKGWEKSLPTKKPKVVGINKESLTLTSFERLKKLFPHAKFEDISSILKELRAVKTKQELKYMKKACEISVRAFESTLDELKKKKLQTEQDVALFLEKKIKEQGGEVAFPTIVAMGKNAATPHYVTSLTPLHKGFLLFDFGASYKHYCADMSRTIYLGAPNTRDREIYTLLQQVQQAGIIGVAEGKELVDLDKLVRQKLGKYNKYFVHSLGHGIGLEVHEAPSFVKNMKVQKNVPFTIEPGIYIPHQLGIRIEDTLYLESEKVQVLTQFPKDLITISFL